MNADANPMDRANAPPRCTVKAKRTCQRCRCPAVTGWAVCRVHGAHGGARPGASGLSSWRAHEGRGGLAGDGG